MKKYFILITAFLFAACTPNRAQTTETHFETRDLAAIVIPELPEQLDFAGEPVPLDNFDTRESLQREMMITMYLHSRTMRTLLESRRYISIIEPILKKYGIPHDFIYLCIAESSLNPDVVSPAKAAGLWQIMSATGKEYGLEVGSTVDERFHIEKATEAACLYLKDSYARFDSWTVAAAAYNLGNTGVTTRMDKQSTKSYYDTFYPEETMRYVFRILSWKLMMEDPARYGFVISDGDYHKEFDSYTVVDVSDKEIVWADVAAENGTNYKMLRLLNNWIRDYTHKNPTGKTYKVKIPGKDFR